MIVLWLLVFAALTVLLAWLRPRLRGVAGQAAVSRKLRRYCAESADDLILPDGRGGLTQVDHIALTAAGLLVIETKNYSGLVFGKASDRTWTQCIGRQRHTFQNPLRQNYGHIKAVQTMSPGVPVAGVVVFTGSAQFPNGYPEGVETLFELKMRLAPERGISIPAEYRRAWRAVLEGARTDHESRRAHLEAVRSRRR